MRSVRQYSYTIVCDIRYTIHGVNDFMLRVSHAHRIFGFQKAVYAISDKLHACTEIHNQEPEKRQRSAIVHPVKRGRTKGRIRHPKEGTCEPTLHRPPPPAQRTNDRIAAAHASPCHFGFDTVLKGEYRRLALGECSLAREDARVKTANVRCVSS
jgi:hypothetical protein